MHITNKKTSLHWQGRWKLATETAEPAEDLPDGIAIIAGVTPGVAREDKHLLTSLSNLPREYSIDCNRVVTILQPVNLSISCINAPNPLDFPTIPVYNSIYTYSPGNGELLWIKLPF